jgi:hypothetical protein
MAAPELIHLRRLIHRTHEGLLSHSGVIDRVRIVLSHATGLPIMAVPPAAIELSGDEVVLHLPDDAHDSVHLAGSLEELGARNDADADLWIAHFVSPEHRRFARLTVDVARRVDLVIEGPEVFTPPTLSLGAIGRAVKRVNADPARLLDICEQRGGVRPEAARCLNADAFGISIRVRFGIVRVEFDASSAPATSDDALALAIESLLARSIPGAS